MPALTSKGAPSVEIGRNQSALLLVTPPLETGSNYQLNVQNIRDLATPPNTLNSQQVTCHSHYYPGIAWDTYTNTALTVPNFNSLTPVRSGLTSAFALGMEARDSFFAVRFRGYDREVARRILRKGGYGD